MITLLIIGVAVFALVGFRRGLFSHAALTKREHEVVLTGKPQFSSSASGCPEAWIDADSKKRLFSWPQQVVPAGTVAPETVYTFTFLEPFFSNGRMSLSRITLDGKSIFDASVCQVHHETMHRTLVTVTSASDGAMPDTLFPNFGRASGCEGSEEMVWVCDSCRRERDRWLDRCRHSGTACLTGPQGLAVIFK